MSTLTLHVRSFHPLANFGPSGLLFHGDNRGFSQSLSVTSRIRLRKTFDLAAASATPSVVASDVSSHPFGMEQDYSAANTRPHATSDGAQIDAYREDGDQGLQAMVGYTGQNFAMPFVQTFKGGYDAVVPGLDVTCSLHLEIDRDEEKLSFAFRMVGDGFTNAEALLVDSAQNVLMLATHRRIGSALHQLRGDRRIVMASSAAEVDFAQDRFGSGIDVHWCLDYATVAGAQVDVLEETGQDPSSVSAWNSMHTNRDARGGFLRRSQDVVPTYAPGRAGSSMPCGPCARWNPARWSSAQRATSSHKGSSSVDTHHPDHFGRRRRDRRRDPCGPCLSILHAYRADTERRDAMLRSHLTLCVDEPLLSEGSTVIVASIPIPEAEWRALAGPNPAAEDEDNRKRPQLKEGDRLFGAYALDAFMTFYQDRL
ncbi:hypothetical protein [Vannielia litorea]|uniref:Uncharacterized protein n=1 Tax=Vannielia litorea TaxID=1217970 RepID=A0A1N6IG62_9RHOB|nr:hypothetical protein [Vannielia litorea]SIO30945.1 hypothetical protein SAMN05444002_3838 [Vannielia litorea]